jgi:hypothetical protein
MSQCIDPITSCFNPKKLDGQVLRKRIKHSTRVAPTTNASYDGIRKFPTKLLQLIFCFRPDDALELRLTVEKTVTCRPYDSRERVRANSRSNDIVSARQFRNPVTKSLVDCISQSSRALKALADTLRPVINLFQPI